MIDKRKYMKESGELNVTTDSIYDLGDYDVFSYWKMEVILQVVDVEDKKRY